MNNRPRPVRAQLVRAAMQYRIGGRTLRRVFSGVTVRLRRNQPRRRRAAPVNVNP